MSEKSEYQKGYEDGKKAGLQWLLIETAPKDGTPIDVWLKGGGRITNVRYLNGVFNEYTRDFKNTGWYKIEAAITHWMPLPQAPEVDRE